MRNMIKYSRYFHRIQNVDLHVVCIFSKFQPPTLNAPLKLAIVGWTVILVQVVAITRVFVVARVIDGAA